MSPMTGDFINQTATRILELVNHQFVNYIGNYDYYLEKKEELTAAYTTASSDSSASQEMSGSSTKQSWQEQKEAQARQRKRANDLKRTEAGSRNWKNEAPPSTSL